MYNNNQFLPSNYMSDCLMKLDKFFYPFRQFLHLMYRDRNPFLIRLECQLCNEPFELFDTIVLPLQCLSREENLNVKPHCFHICCVDIIDIDEANRKKSNPQSEMSAFSANDQCVVCKQKAKNEEEELRNRQRAMWESKLTSKLHRRATSKDAYMIKSIFGSFR